MVGTVVIIFVMMVVIRMVMVIVVLTMIVMRMMIVMFVVIDHNYLIAISLMGLESRGVSNAPSVQTFEVNLTNKNMILMMMMIIVMIGKLNRT